ncbi:MAG: ABC transporter substrate-binding protein [Armatimonadota bacterium]
MRIITLLCIFSLGVLTLSLCLSRPAAQAAKEPYVIGAVLDITGMGSPLGTPERDTVLMLEKQINARGGVNGHPIKVIILDNQSDEAKSVTAVKKLIEEHKVLAIIGPSQTGTTLACAETVQAAKVPMISCAAGNAINQPVKPWIFKTAQSDVHAASKVLDYCKAKKLTKVAILSVSNAFGDSGLQQIKAQAKSAGVTLITEETFAPTDTDMTAQILRIRGKKPQAVICWGTNPGPAIVAKNMKTLGFKVPLIMSHGVSNHKFIELAGAGAEGVIFPTGKLLVAQSIAAADPQKKTLIGYAANYKKTYKVEADHFGGHAYDAFYLICNALGKVGPDRGKIRDYLETAKFTGVSGVFKFSKTDHNGMTKDAFVMVQVRNGKWVLVK